MKQLVYLSQWFLGRLVFQIKVKIVMLFYVAPDAGSHSFVGKVAKSWGAHSREADFFPLLRKVCLIDRWSALSAGRWSSLSSTIWKPLFLHGERDTHCCLWTPLFNTIWPVAHTSTEEVDPRVCLFGPENYGNVDQLSVRFNWYLSSRWHIKMTPCFFLSVFLFCITGGAMSVEVYYSNEILNWCLSVFG